jgi:hypothetical protein
MSETIIDKTIAFILKSEAWKSYEGDHLVAIWGVDKRFWPKEFEQLEKMSESESKQLAGQFYMVQFWTRYDCDNLPYPLNAFHCDTAVNSERIAKLCIEKTKDPYLYLLYRIKEYAIIAQKNEEKRIYLRGWVNRCINLLDTFPGATVAQPVSPNVETVKKSETKSLSLWDKIKMLWNVNKLIGVIKMNKDKQTTIASIVAIAGMILSYFNIDLATIITINNQAISLSDAITVVALGVWGILTNKTDG